MEGIFDFFGTLSGAKYAWIIFVILIGLFVIFVKAVIAGIFGAIIFGLIGSFFGETGMVIGTILGFLGGVGSELDKITEKKGSKQWTPKMLKVRKINKTFQVILAAIVIFSAGCDFSGIEPPLIVSTRKSIIDKGIVFEVTNKSSKFLHGITVNVRDENGIDHTHYVNTLEPHGSFTVGWFELDNWEPTLESRLEVSVQGYLMNSGPWSIKHSK